MVKFVRFIQNPANKCTQFMTHIMVVFLQLHEMELFEFGMVASLKEHKNAVSYVSVRLKTLSVIKCHSEYFQCVGAIASILFKSSP